MFINFKCEYILGFTFFKSEVVKHFDSVVRCSRPMLPCRVVWTLMQAMGSLRATIQPYTMLHNMPWNTSVGEYYCFNVNIVRSHAFSIIYLLFTDVIQSIHYLFPSICKIKYCCFINLHDEFETYVLKIVYIWANTGVMYSLYDVTYNSL